MNDPTKEYPTLEYRTPEPAADGSSIDLPPYRRYSTAEFRFRARIAMVFILCLLGLFVLGVCLIAGWRWR